MKKITLLILLFFACSFLHAQLVCPTSIKTSGQSSPAEPIFTVPNGQNGCNADWPTTITVNGSLTYTFVSCNGGNLQYELNPASQTPPPTFEMTVDYGNGTVCSYDSSGNLITLSSAEFKDYKVSFTPNPTAGLINIQLNNSAVLELVEVFTITGRKVFTSTSKTIDLSNFNSGIYLLKTITNLGSQTNRIILK